MRKPKKIEVHKDRYFSQVVYEYRGHRYEVEYANGWQICCTPAWIQHRDAQAKIDGLIDNPKPMPQKVDKTAAEQMDEIYDMLGWND